MEVLDKLDYNVADIRNNKIPRAFIQDIIRYTRVIELLLYN